MNHKEIAVDATNVTIFEVLTLDAAATCDCDAPCCDSTEGCICPPGCC